MGIFVLQVYSLSFAGGADRWSNLLVTHVKIGTKDKGDVALTFFLQTWGLIHG